LDACVGGSVRQRKEGEAKVNVVTLVIATVGALLGGISLCWQVATWRKSGPVVKVYVHEAARPQRAADGDTMSRPDLGMTLTVNATNTGRSPARILSWGYQMENKSMSVKYELLFRNDPKLPADLLPLGLCSFTFDKGQLVDGMTRRNMLTARGFVDLASGERISAPNDSVTFRP
jgi:hypothetical protein